MGAARWYRHYVGWYSGYVGWYRAVLALAIYADASIVSILCDPPTLHGQQTIVPQERGPTVSSRSRNCWDSLTHVIGCAGCYTAVV